tara:strand:- start:3430 stop:6753 length:3324 start_codon:yes stop_codon:yes gene_type:complete
VKLPQLIGLYKEHAASQLLQQALTDNPKSKIHFKGLVGSQNALLAANISQEVKRPHLFILSDKEEAAYFLNDLESILQKEVLFFPSSYRRPYQIEETDNANVLLRAEVLNTLNHHRHPIIVSYPEALFEKVVSQKHLKQNSLDVKRGDTFSINFLNETLQEYGFDRVDFVIEPGQYSIRGGILDVFSFSNEQPYRMEFFDDEIESIRTFNINTQLSQETHNKFCIVPNVQEQLLQESQESFLEYLSPKTQIWFKNIELTKGTLDSFFNKAIISFEELKDSPLKHLSPQQLFINGKSFTKQIDCFPVIEFGQAFHYIADGTYEFLATPQPTFNKQFDLLASDLHKGQENYYQNLILCASSQQVDRFQKIFEDIGQEVEFTPLVFSLNKGFIDHQKKIACYTDHQIFERYHKFRLKTGFANKQAITLKQLTNLQPGDFVTHIDHGIGKFAGLHKIDVNGKKQEAIKLLYRDNDTLFISIHSLHKIAKYSGKDGAEPRTNKLGSGQWLKTKAKTKSRVKQIAYDLIHLYAKRKAKSGFEFSPDSFLQYELEASFMYEDTPDQYKATQAVKNDMENSMPMDRLICGDVGFGKTEVAIRAAFKAVADNKQVAVLVPTTILAMQHAKSFKKRLQGLPCKIDYINRFRTTKEQREILKGVAEGEINILIGTHRIVGKDVAFHDLGLLIIDEEQKFGVAVKDKLKTFKANVDTLTLTATPIPRTLQFSLMGARDLSIINTPPPNRHPVQTEVCTFDEELIRDAITYEVSRGGQVYFVHNRIENIQEVAGLVQRLSPNAKVGIGHGKMEGKKLEQIMLAFIEGEFDVLVSTTIIENGLDIPNANTIIINNANNFGLSDLHQMRGRVGRSNKKAFCYLLAPPAYSLTSDARKRLNALEQFSNLGSGFNIAMRDLDIRGAGDLLGAEQSGFIGDIGFDMYQKILDEAIQELKEEEFKDLYQEDKNKVLVADCQLDTDLEILIPEEYISSVSERLFLYKELNELKTEKELNRFQVQLNDRFGAPPHQVQELVQSLRLRWLGKQIGFPRLALKNNKLTGYFPPQDSEYFQTERFGKALEYLKQNHSNCEMKEVKEKLIFRINNIHTVQEAILQCQKILGA